MTKEQLAQKIAREIYKGKGKLESFYAFKYIRSYFADLSLDDLEDIAGQYGININWSNLKASKQDPHQTELQIYTPKGKNY